MSRLLLAALAAALLAAPAAAHAAPVTQGVTFTAGDGARLYAEVRGEGSLAPRPLIVEFTPYATASPGTDFGPEYNHVTVHARGTGKSTGRWTAVGPRDQQDVSEFLAWACDQPFSNGRIGLYGFSASAIAVYNSLHLPLECVDAAALMAGTSDLYRDLLYPGGILNFVPGAVVGFGVGIPLLYSSASKPVEGAESGAGFLQTITEILQHHTRDEFWEEHSQRPGPNAFPVLVDNGFYDPESRGPFESFRKLREHGAHLLVLGAHDGHPAGLSPFPDYKRWFDRYLLGQDNGIDREPRVKLWLGNGSRENLLAGKTTRVDADDWPVPGTRWRKLFLASTQRLADSAPAAKGARTYPSALSPGTATDPNTTSAAGPYPGMIPGLTDMTLAEPLSASWTSAPLQEAIDVAGPAALNVHLASTAPDSAIQAVIADVHPDGRAFPVGIGRLRISFPGVDRTRSLIDGDGEIVQPYGDYTHPSPAPLLKTREYHVEFWPLGNRFAAGHRIRLYLVGPSWYMAPTTPALHTVSFGGATPSRLLLPILP